MMLPESAPIVGLRDVGMLSPGGRRLVAVEVLLDRERCVDLRLGMQVVVLMPDDEDTDVAAG
jgi:hypothetical protein